MPRRDDAKSVDEHLPRRQGERPRPHVIASHVADDGAEPSAGSGKSLPQIPVLARDVSVVEPSGAQHEGTPNDAAVNGESGQPGEHRKHVRRNRPVFARDDIAAGRNAHPATAPRVNLRVRFDCPIPDVERVGENRVVAI